MCGLHIHGVCALCGGIVWMNLHETRSDLVKQPRVGPQRKSAHTQHALHTVESL